MRPAIGLLHTAQSNAGEDFVRTWTLGQDFSALLGTSGAEDGFEATLTVGTEIDGALMEGTLMEGTEGSGSEIERSSTLGK